MTYLNKLSLTNIIFTIIIIDSEVVPIPQMNECIIYINIIEAGYKALLEEAAMKEKNGQ